MVVVVTLRAKSTPSKFLVLEVLWYPIGWHLELLATKRHRTSMITHHTRRYHRLRQPVLATAHLGCHVSCCSAKRTYQSKTWWTGCPQSARPSAMLSVRLVRLPPCNLQRGAPKHGPTAKRTSRLLGPEHGACYLRANQHMTTSAYLLLCKYYLSAE